MPDATPKVLDFLVAKSEKNNSIYTKVQPIKELTKSQMISSNLFKKRNEV